MLLYNYINVHCMKAASLRQHQLEVHMDITQTAVSAQDTAWSGEAATGVEGGGGFTGIEV